MYCPNCGTFSQDGARFCFQCGAALSPQRPAAVQPPVSDPVPAAAPPRKGSHRVPLLILTVLSLLGLLLFFLLPMGADTGSAGAFSEAPWFTLEDGTLYFDESLYHGSPELTVPATLNGEPVLYLGDYCFAYCDELTAVLLPDTLIGIGESAFIGCTDLRGIQIPDSVTAIGAHTFEDCTSLEAVSIPSGVESIGAYAFRRCSSLDFIFYNGSFSQWKELYDAKVNPRTTVYCTDGSFALG